MGTELPGKLKDKGYIFGVKDEEKITEIFIPYEKLSEFFEKLKKKLGEMGYIVKAVEETRAISVPPTEYFGKKILVVKPLDKVTALLFLCKFDYIEEKELMKEVKKEEKEEKKIVEIILVAPEEKKAGKLEIKIEGIGVATYSDLLPKTNPNVDLFINLYSIFHKIFVVPKYRGLLESHFEKIKEIVKKVASDFS